MRNVTLVIAAMVATTSAHAATVGIETGKPASTLTDQGLASSYLGTKGLYTERFNVFANPTVCGRQNNNLYISNVGTGDWGLASGRFIGRALPPGTNSASIAAGKVDTDKSCYLAGPNPLSSANQTSTISPLVIGFAGKAPILYVSFYWGSIDTYNYVNFYDKNGNTINFTNVATSAGTGAVTGSDVINLFGLGLAESRVIDFTFTAAENFGYMLLGSGSTAFELDNLSWGAVNPVPAPAVVGPNVLVPEPGLAGLLGIGVASIVVGRRRQLASTKRGANRQAH